MKKLYLLILILIFIFNLTACKETKKYKVKDLTIEVKDIFRKKTVEGYDLYLESERLIASFTKDSKDDLQKLGFNYDQLTIQEYVDLYTINNNIDIISEESLNGIKQIDFERNDENLFFWIRAYFYKTNSGIWLIQFFCDKEYKEEFIPQIEEWLKTMKIK